MKNKHIGSDFDDFLREEGILEEVEAAAIKKIIAEKHQLAEEANKRLLFSANRTTDLSDE